MPALLTRSSDNLIESHATESGSHFFSKDHLSTRNLQSPTAEGSQSISCPTPPTSVVAESGLSSSSESRISSRQERKIRGQDGIYYGWFISTSSRPIDQPGVDGGTGQESDVFVHIHGFGKQIWLRSRSGTWLPIQCGHRHPLLDTHRLVLNGNGEPRWVTRQTMVTYASREKN